MTADRARGALAVLQDADGKFICEVPCGYIVEQTASAHKPRRIQAQRRRRAMLRRRVALTVALLTVAALLAADVLTRYRAELDGEENVGRVLPAEYCFFTGDGRRNHFTTEWKSTDCFGWTLESPYTD